MGKAWAQLEERSLQSPKATGSNPLIVNLIAICLANSQSANSNKMKIVVESEWNVTSHILNQYSFRYFTWWNSCEVDVVQFAIPISVTRLGDILPLWQNLKVFGNFWGSLSILQSFNIIYGIFINIVTNGQILKTTYLSIWSHWYKCRY